MNLKSSLDRLGHGIDQSHRGLEAHIHADGEGTATTESARPLFTIAISREAGANGSHIGRTVAEKLGWPIYDREILKGMAEEMGLRASHLEALDERRQNWLQECLEALSSAPLVNESVYVRHLLEMLNSLCEKGNCVIVGRGAAQVLPAPSTLRVRLVGPLEDRISSVVKRYGASRAEAARRIEKTDRQRSLFIKDHFNKDPADPRLYDLVINSTRFSPAECAEVIVEALKQIKAHAAAARQPVASA